MAFLNRCAMELRVLLLEFTVPVVDLAVECYSRNHKLKSDFRMLLERPLVSLTCEFK